MRLGISKYILDIPSSFGATSYQPPPVEQARSMTFSTMVSTTEAMMLNRHPEVRTRIAIRGSLVGRVSISWSRPSGSNRAEGDPQSEGRIQQTTR
jgi:hypothetical protein